MKYQNQYYETYFLVLIAYQFLVTFLRKMSAEIYGFSQQVDNLLLGGLVLLFIHFFLRHNSFNINKIIGTYCIFLLYGIFISLYNFTGVRDVVFQLSHELKVILVIIPVLSLCMSRKFVNILLLLFRLVMACTVLLIIFRIAAASSYDMVFNNGAHGAPLRAMGTEISRYVGVFWHPSQLVFFCVSYYFLLESFNRKKYQKEKCLVFFVMLLTFQRFEIAIFITVILLYKFSMKMRFDYLFVLKSTFVFSFVAAIIVAITLYTDATFNYDTASPRNVMLVESISVMEDSSYFGAGWGTIGSALAAQDQGLAYYKLRIDDIWWISWGYYFFDSYWPHIIGETGLIGLISVFAFMFLIFDKRVISRSSGSLMFFIFISSFLSLNLQSLFKLLIVAVTIAAVNGVTVRSTKN